MSSDETGASLLTSFQADVQLQQFIPSKGKLILSFVGGCLGGVANVLVGHPFDTLKVRMQMLQTSLTSSAKSMIVQEGPFSLYKGITSPLYNVPVIYSLCFGSYEMALWALGVGFKQDPTLWQATAAGSWAGFVISFVLTPMELIKCRQQMEGVGKKVSSTKGWLMTKQVIQTQGIRGLFKANTLTIIREVPANAVYFAAYVYFKNAMKPKLGDGGLNTVIVGGIAGLLSWVVSYPQDVVKTRIQCDVTNMYKKHKFFNDSGILDCWKKIYKNEGFGGFWKGFSACALRATFAEAVTFTVYDSFTKRFIH